MTCTPESKISSPVITNSAWPPPNNSGKSLPKWVLTWSKVPCNKSRVSASIFAIASVRVCIASFKSADCASKNCLRSRELDSSSKAAIFTGPKDWISVFKRFTSLCKAPTFKSALKFASSVVRSASASDNNVANCSKFKRAACSRNCKSTTLSRIGCRLRSTCIRDSSASRNWCNKASCSVRAFAKAASRALRASNRPCNLSCASSSLRVSSSWAAASCLSWISMIWVRAVLWSRCKSVMRCCNERVAKAASWAAISAERSDSRKRSRSSVERSNFSCATCKASCKPSLDSSDSSNSAADCSWVWLTCSICWRNSLNSPWICAARWLYCSSAWVNCILSTSKPCDSWTACSAFSRACSAAWRAAW